MQFYHAGAARDTPAYAGWKFKDVVFEELEFSDADKTTPSVTLTFSGTNTDEFWSTAPVTGANAVTHGPANIVLTSVEARALEPVARNPEYQVALAWKASSAGPADSTTFIASQLHMQFVSAREAGGGLATGKPKIVVHLGQTKKQDVQFKAELLKLARVIE